MTGKVYIVGAGPGDPELLTVKALKVIEMADVILYDRLVGKSIEDMLKRMGKEIIYVGKNSYENGAERQRNINELMVKLAREGKIVVRLKGGDPFVFGRGGEEVEYLIRNNIPFEVIPGLSSVIAVPTSAKIPLTHKGLSSTIFVITGRNLEDIGKSALNGTIVVLMGKEKIKEICRRLIELGKDPKTPVAVIENGTLDNQRVYYGNLETIGDIVEKNVKGVALIVIGDVVELGKKFNSRKL
ncbi:uroporphyrinogen-III C-methyltransferase [Archaeoglobus profundus]|uniref:uroporphyrinogen-III C-methyltransferase n=2 Tax=Archaeoglobus profundus TaxID=84156 RepID=D2RFY5_ARCPA|nr:uroporphyrinogen-III C-methyltransferase [Archaeoglobus profundus]ADB57210.1 uroporphyrin-III C-methyltransferase [Archaeoglobus profundus DSM 5631]